MVQLGGAHVLYTELLTASWLNSYITQV